MHHKSTRHLQIRVCIYTCDLWDRVDFSHNLRQANNCPKQHSLRLKWRKVKESFSQRTILNYLDLCDKLAHFLNSHPYTNIENTAHPRQIRIRHFDGKFQGWSYNLGPLENKSRPMKSSLVGLINCTTLPLGESLVQELKPSPLKPAKQKHVGT